MNNFSIRQLENFSDVKAHTIRIWERRYLIFKPNRSKTNIRDYSLNDVNHLLGIALLIKNGARISNLARTDKGIISQRVQSLSSVEARQNNAISQLIVSMFAGETEQFEDILNKCVLTWDINVAINELILPFLQKVQLLSYNDTSNETHFAVTAIRQKIMLGLEDVAPPAKEAKSALLFLPKDEHYDLILLYTAYILKQKGIKVWYMGTNISWTNLQLALISKKPDFLYTYIPQKGKFKMQILTSFLEEHLPETIFTAVGCDKPHVPEKNQRNVHFIHYRDLMPA